MNIDHLTMILGVSGLLCSLLTLHLLLVWVLGYAAKQEETKEKNDDKLL